MPTAHELTYAIWVTLYLGKKTKGTLETKFGHYGLFWVLLQRYIDYGLIRCWQSGTKIKRWNYQLIVEDEDAFMQEAYELRKAYAAGSLES